MKIKSFIALCMTLILSLSVSSCGYRLVKVEDLESTTLTENTNIIPTAPDSTTLPAETTTNPA